MGPMVRRDPAQSNPRRSSGGAAGPPRGAVSGPRPSALALFRRTAQAMVGELVERLAEAGYPDLSGSHHPVFEHLDLGGTRLTTLAARADVTHQSMSELVATLEERGYVARHPDPGDGRARIVRLTPRGLRMIRRANEEIALLEQRWDERFRRAGLDGDWRRGLAGALETATGPSRARSSRARPGSPGSGGPPASRAPGA